MAKVVNQMQHTKKTGPLECTSSKFFITPNLASYPVDNYAKLLKSTKNVLRNMSIEQIKKSVLSLTVFYESLSFTIIEEKPALTFETLLANIGGKQRSL